MSLINRIHRSIGNFSKRRHGVDHVPLEIGHRRIYILPTRMGLLFAVAVVAMGLGGMNYGNNLALLLAFLLTALGFVAMHHCHRNLAGLRVHLAANEPVFVGQRALLRLALENPTPQHRFALQLEIDTHQGELAQAPGNTHTQLTLPLPAARRGWLRLNRVMLCTRYPLGLFRGWTVLHFELSCLVYPKPSDHRSTPPPAVSDSGNQDLQHGDEEFAGLRPFHPGDSPTRIAWKAYAREQELLVKQYAGNRTDSRMLDWHTLGGMDAETRLSRLCRWVLDSHQQGIAYGLQLPGFKAAPALSDAHRNRCLTALAVFQGGA